MNTRFFIPLLRYWGAKTPEVERKAYATLLALGAPPSYGESEEEIASLINEYGLERWKEEGGG